MPCNELPKYRHRYGSNQGRQRPIAGVVWTLLALLVVSGSLPGVQGVGCKVTHWNKCIPDEELGLWLYQINRQTCEKECHARTDCEAIQYNGRAQKCGFLFKHSEQQLTLCKNYIYVRKMDMQIPKDSKKCSCPPKQRCRNNGSCEFAECSIPTTSGELSFMGNMRRIGSKLKMKAQCNPGLWALNESMNTGDYTITCQENGQFDVKDICVSRGKVWYSSGSMNPTKPEWALEDGPSFECSRAEPDSYDSDSAWWMIDFGYPLTIDHVTIKSAPGTWDYVSLYKNLSIYVSDNFEQLHNGRYEGILCYDASPRQTYGSQIVRFSCRTNTTGRYLKVIRQARELEICHITFYSSPAGKSLD